MCAKGHENELSGSRACVRVIQELFYSFNIPDTVSMSALVISLFLCLFLLVVVEAPALAQVEYSIRTPLGLFQSMKADTVTNDLSNYFAPHPEISFRVTSPIPGVNLVGETNVLIALDFDNDGYTDILQGNRSYPGEEPSRILINKGDGTFGLLENSGIPRSVFSASAGDLDNDGWVDLVFWISEGGTRFERWEDRQLPPIEYSLVYALNQGGRELGPLLTIQEPRVGYSMLTRPVLSDVNGDSYLDLIYCQKPIDGVPFLETLFGGREGFENQQTRIQDFSQSPSLSVMDIDDDNDPDLLVQEWGFFPYRKRYLYLIPNLNGEWGPGVKVVAPPASRITAPIWADVDNDGRFEFFSGVSDFDGGHNLLCFPDGTGGFEDRGREWGVWGGYNMTSGAVFGDWNNDGWLDMMQCRNFNEGGWTESPLYLNEEGTRFVNISDRADGDLGPGSLTGLAFDADLDGDVDIVLGHMTYYTDVVPMADTGLDLLINESAVGNWLAVRLEGTVSNRMALGSKVALHSGSDTWNRVTPNGVHWGTAQPSATMHFGLGASVAVDSLVVVWPNGSRENFGPQSAGTRLNLRQGQVGTNPGR